MSKIKNLHKRGNVFYARVAVPKELRLLRDAAEATARENPKEITRSLGTTDRKVVDRLLPEFLARVYREFDAEVARLRSGGVRPLAAPTAHDLAQVREEFFLEELHRDDFERNSRKSQSELEQMGARLQQRLAKTVHETDLELFLAPGVLEFLSARDAAEMSSKRRGYLKAELQKHLAQSEYVLVSDAIEYASQTKGLDLKRDSLEYKTLGRGLIKEWLKALEIAERRDQGVHDDDHLMVEKAAGASADRKQGSSSGVIDLAAERSRRPARGETLRSYLDAHMKEQKDHLNRGDQQALRATIRQFVECNGDRPVTDYGRADMAAYKKGLQKYPANAAKLYPGISFHKVIERNRTDGHPTLSSNTVRSKLGVLAVFGKWLEANVNGVDATSFATTLPKRDDRKRMEPFTLDDVRRILNSYAFVGCASARNYQKPGTFKLRDWHFWLTLIAAFTGARVNEIVQMDITDLRQENGIWAFDITEEGDHQSLKTKSSKRLLPVHPQLLELGIFDYVDGLVARGATSLFHDVSIDRDGRRAEAAGKWFRKFLQRVGVKQADDLGGSHRWRHTLADALRRADIDTYDISATLGHKIDIGRMTNHYGREMDMSLSKRQEILSKATYPGVDFSLLKG